MARKAISVLFASILAFGLHAYDLDLVNLKAIDNVAAYTEDLGFAIENRSHLSGWVTDDFWKSAYSRSDLIARMESFYGKICATPEPDNQEYLLLKAIISEYLYHLDAPGYFEDVVDNYGAIDALEKRDYRYKWLLGQFYAKAACPFDAIRQFEYVAERVPRDNLHPQFFHDYAYAQSLALMSASAMRNLELYFKVTGLSSEGDSLYKSLRKSFTAYESGKDLSFDELYVPFESDEGTGFLSRLLGMWLVPQGEWGLAYTGLMNDTSIVKFQSKRIIHSSGETITYSIMMLSSLDDGGEMASKFRESLPNLRQVDIPNDEGAEIYEYSDPMTYPHIGGSHGYLALIRRDYHEGIDAEIERPFRLPKGDGQESTWYYVLKEQYARYRGTITHVILLDTCEYIFEESKKDFFEFIEASEFR